MTVIEERVAPAESGAAYGAWVAFAAVSLIWGTTFLGIRVAVESIPTLMLTAIRFLGAGSILLTIALVRRDPFPATRRDWINQAINGVIMVCFANGALVFASNYIASGLAALLAATIPLWMTLLEGIIGKGHITLRKSTGLLLGFAGVAFLVAPGIRRPDTGSSLLLGVLGTQLSCLAWNIGTLRSKHRPAKNAAPMAVASIHMLCGGGTALVISLLLGDASRVYFTTRTTIALFHLMIFGSVIAYSAYLYALARMPASKLSVYSYINPAVAVLVGWMILSEPLTLRMIAAMVIILGGVAVVQSEQRT
jgi:drug/metabolite transporter (DMT)-like permease